MTSQDPGYSYDQAYGRYLGPLGWKQETSPDPGRVRWVAPNHDGILDVLPLGRGLPNHWQLTLLPASDRPIYGQINGQGHETLLAILDLKSRL